MALALLGFSASAAARTEWGSRMNLPTDAEIRAFRTGSRSPYIVCRPSFGVGRYGEYAVDFRADYLPRGTYLCGCNFDLDYGSLTGRYSRLWRDYNGVAAYAGFQVWDDGTRAAIFSVWDTYARDRSGRQTTFRARRLRPSNPLKGGPFGGEGSGVQCLVSYPWQAGRTYRLLIQVYPGETDGVTRLSMWVCDLSSNAWQQLVEYEIDIGGLTMSDACAFLENYTPATAGEIRTMELSNFRVSRGGGQWTAASRATFEQNYDYPGSYAYGSDGTRFWAITTGLTGRCRKPAQNAAFKVTRCEKGSPY